MFNFKLFNLLLFIFIFIVTMSVGKKEQRTHKLASGTIKKLREMFPEANFEKIATDKQLFQDIFLERQIDDKLQFGHVYENPIGWEQRFEEKDFLANRHRGKVKWANVDGRYGEQYWDINHK